MTDRDRMLAFLLEMLGWDAEISQLDLLALMSRLNLEEAQDLAYLVG